MQPETGDDDGEEQGRERVEGAPKEVAGPAHGLDAGHRGIDVLERHRPVHGIGGLEHVDKSERVRRHLAAHPVCFESGRDLERLHGGGAHGSQLGIVEHPVGDPVVGFRGCTDRYHLDGPTHGPTHDDSTEVSARIASSAWSKSLLITGALAIRPVASR